ncbi:hypothetical protein Tco_1096735 [Tanacetum coccineum]
MSRTPFQSKQGKIEYNKRDTTTQAVMSSASSAVTYTSVYTDSEPGRVFWGADEEISDGAYVHQASQHDPGLVAEPIYLKYIPLEDEHEFPVRAPLPPLISPYSESPRYVAESDPEEDPEEYEDDETEGGLVDYPMDGEDDGDDDDGDSSRDDANDEDEDEGDDEEEEEEHLAPTDSAVVVPTIEPVSPPEGTKPVIPPPSTTFLPLELGSNCHRLQVFAYPSTRGKGALARCTAPPAHSSSPPMLSPLPPSSGCPTQIQTLRIATTQALIDVVTTILPSPPLPPLPHSYIPHRCPYEVKKSSTARPIRGRGIDYGLLATVGYGLDPAEAVPEDLYALLDDAQDGRTRILQRVTMDSQRVDLLMGDRMTLREIVWIVEEEVYASREAWAHSIGLS